MRGRSFVLAAIFTGTLLGAAKAGPIHFFGNSWSTAGSNGFYGNTLSTMIAEIFINNNVPIHDTDILRQVKKFTRFDIICVQTLQPSCNALPHTDGKVQVLVYDWEGVDLDANLNPTEPVPIVSNELYIIDSPNCNESLRPVAQWYFDNRNNYQPPPPPPPPPPPHAIPALTPVGLVAFVSAILMSGALILFRKRKPAP